MKFYYTRTITYTYTVEADTAEEADALIAGVSLQRSDIVCTMDTDWQEDGYTD